MKIDDAIKSLIEVKKRGVKNIIFAHWEADLFDEKDDKDWETICEHIDNEMDWSSTFDAIAQSMDLMHTTTAENIYSRNQESMKSFFNDPRAEDAEANPELVDDIINAMLQAEGVDEFPQKIEDSIREQIIDGLT